MLLSMGLQRVRHDWVTKHMHTTSEASWALESQGGNILESRLKKKKKKKEKAVLVWMHTFFLKLHLANNCIFYRLRDWGFIAILHWAILLTPFFPISIFSLHVSESHFGSSCNISNFFIIIIFVMVICDHWYSYCNCFGEPQTVPIYDRHINDKCCMCSDYLINQLFPHLSPSLWVR